MCFDWTLWNYWAGWLDWFDRLHGFHGFSSVTDVIDVMWLDPFGSLDWFDWFDLALFGFVLLDYLVLIGSWIWFDFDLMCFGLIGWICFAFAMIWYMIPILTGSAWIWFLVSDLSWLDLELFLNAKPFACFPVQLDNIFATNIFSGASETLPICSKISKQNNLESPRTENMELDTGY